MRSFYTYFRYFNVYGERQPLKGQYDPVVGIFQIQKKNGEPMTKVGDGEQRRDFTHIDDIVDGLIKIGFGTESHEDAWELGTGFNYSLNEVAELFVEKFSAVKVYMTDERGNYRETIRVNNDAINRLGWTPTDKLKEYINSL
jgi:UDP-glucose 4-epimerase